MRQTHEPGRADRTFPHPTEAPPVITEQVRAALLRALHDGRGANPVLLARSARRLGLSARTLQRRLRASGASFSGLLRETRELLALRALSDGQQAVSEISDLLAFSEVSAFSRAFKRWTGMRPTRFRHLVKAPRHARAERGGEHDSR
jgi:AraC-like DNA-binding protein